ncbi:MAG: LapA family protein [Pseudomonadota bacterium]
MKRLLTSMFLAALFPLLVAFFFANRTVVTISFDPSSLEKPALFFDVPLFVGLMGAMFIGFLLGAMGMWISTTRLRQRSRDAKRKIRELERDVKTARSAEPLDGGTNLPAVRA